MSTTTSPGAVPTTSSRTAWLIGGALAVATAAGAAGLAMRSQAPAATTPPAESLARDEALVAPVTPGTPVPAAPAAAQAKSTKTDTKTDTKTAGATPAKPATKPATTGDARATAAATTAAAATTTAAAAPVCVDCGTVQSVQPVTKKGDGSGVGAVAGGLVGAVLGNQVGKGDGRQVATVVGAIGGGLAGHEIEKRSKSTTVYAVKLKMDDGSVRTIEQAEKPAVGARVQVEGKTLKPLPAGKA